MDYKELLIKYMRYNTNHHGVKSPLDFMSKEECQELDKIWLEANKEYQLEMPKDYDYSEGAQRVGVVKNDNHRTVHP